MVAWNPTEADAIQATVPGIELYTDPSWPATTPGAEQYAVGVDVWGPDREHKLWRVGEVTFHATLTECLPNTPWEWHWSFDGLTAVDPYPLPMTATKPTAKHPARAGGCSMRTRNPSPAGA